MSRTDIKLLVFAVAFFVALEIFAGFAISWNLTIGLAIALAVSAVTVPPVMWFSDDVLPKLIGKLLRR